MMEKYVYEITKCPTETFNQLVFFCSEKGQCAIDQVPNDQTKTLENLLNEKGAQGWELVQLSFGNDGAIAFWKRRKPNSCD
jgi:hypothetical protein